MKFRRRTLLGLALVPLLSSTQLTAEDTRHDPKLLAAARAANSVYQRNIDASRKALTSDLQTERLNAIKWLGRRNDPIVIPDLLPFIDRDVHSAEEVAAAVNALTWLKVDISPQLREIAKNYPELDTMAYSGMARLAKWGSEDWKSRVNSEDKATRASSITNLGNDLAHGAGDILAEAMLTDKDPHVRRMAVIGLGKLGDSTYGPELARALSDPNPRIRRYAADAIANMGYMEGIPNLLMAMQSNVASKHLNKALIRLCGEDFGFDHRSNLIDRQAAIERAFVWYSAQQVAP